MEGEALEERRIEGIDRSSGDIGEGDAEFDPFTGGNVAGVFAQWERGAETGGKFGNLEALGVKPRGAEW